MAVPTLTKTWQYALNLANTPSGVLETDMDAVFLLIKDAMKAFDTSPWTCAGSSNSVTANMTGTDNLSTVANIVHNTAGNAHSWIVLTSPNGMQICFDFVSGTVSRMTAVMSPGALFTGGSTTARPTATDSQTILNDVFWGGAISSTGGQYYSHVIHTSDGLCTRVYICMNSLVAGYWSFEKVSGPIDGWANPIMAAMVGIGNSATDTTLLSLSNWLGGTAKYSSQGPATTMALSLTAESALNGTGSILGALDAANELARNYGDGPEYPIVSCGLFHSVTATQKGRHGETFDLYWTNAALLTGDTFPDDGTHEFQVMGDQLVPTGGTTLLLG